MYCANCGHEVNSSDNYCSNCGKAISRKTPQEMENKGSSTSPETSVPAEPAEKSNSISWGYAFLYVGVGLAIIGCFAAIIIPELAGEKANGQALMALAFWIGIATAIRGKQKGKSVWRWFLIGFLGIGLIVVALLSFIMGFLKA